MGAITKSDAHLRAAHGVDLLVTVGARLPKLGRASIADTLSPSEIRRLDSAVNSGQHDRLLANLAIWDRSGRVLYSSGDVSEGTRPPTNPELLRALAGKTFTEIHPKEFDLSSGKSTGVLDAFEPLIDERGVYGAVEVSLPLQPIEAAATGSQTRGMLFVLAGGLLVWLLLLPLSLRLARSQARDWIPGRRRTLRAFRQALANGHIVLAYQPQVDPSTGRIEAVEALVRWERQGELVAPARFLPAVETSSLMAQLTDRVLELALSQNAAWRSSGIAVRMSVNLSATDLADTTLPQRIATKLDAHGVMGQNLTLEVTETAILEDATQAHAVLTALDQMGMDIAVDDFGTGHASISRLHGLPVTEVKIDRSFVSDTGARSRSYLTAMVGFGQSLGLRVVAEGVEDAETLAILDTLGCDLAQGYLISRPIDAAAMTTLLGTAASAAPLSGSSAALPQTAQDIAFGSC
jgi:EAL domain-containing protein (putative c-di-GMP-specific phosphodiesterase class I)